MVGTPIVGMGGANQYCHVVFVGGPVGELSVGTLGWIVECVVDGFGV